MADDDFEYEQHDILAMRVKFEDMVQAERKGFWWGLVGGVATTVILKRKTNQLPWMRNTLGVLAGSQLYGLTTGTSKSNYASAAAQINRKSSKTLNAILKY